MNLIVSPKHYHLAFPPCQIKKKLFPLLFVLSHTSKRKRFHKCCNLIVSWVLAMLYSDVLMAIIAISSWGMNTVLKCFGYNTSFVVNELDWKHIGRKRDEQCQRVDLQLQVYVFFTVLKQWSFYNHRSKLYYFRPSNESGKFASSFNSLNIFLRTEKDWR